MNAGKNDILLPLSGLFQNGPFGIPLSPAESQRPARRGTIANVASKITETITEFVAHRGDSVGFGALTLCTHNSTRSVGPDASRTSTSRAATGPVRGVRWRFVPPRSCRW